jgi:hypothetical protein
MWKLKQVNLIEVKNRIVLPEAKKQRGERGRKGWLIGTKMQLERRIKF